jgi:hypothetical protein
MDDNRGQHGRTHGDWQSDDASRVDRLTALSQMVDSEPSASGHPPGLISSLNSLCAVAVREVPASGAGLSLTAGQPGAGSAAAWAGHNAQRLEELQFSLGEGPCIEAVDVRRPAFEPDLTTTGSRRWPLYAPAACDLGARAVFAVPLQMGAARLGVLDIYRDQPGSLTADGMRDVFILAEVALALLLESQRTRNRESFEKGMNEVVGHRTVIYQAQGMVMVALGITLPEALSRLQAHAFSTGKSLADVAQDVLDGTTVLDKDGEA